MHGRQFTPIKKNIEAYPLRTSGKGGKGLGRGGDKRHHKILRDNIQSINKPTIRRLARRGGVKRISAAVYEETRSVLKVFLESVIRDAVTYTEYAHRKTVTPLDIVHALKLQGHSETDDNEELASRSTTSSKTVWQLSYPPSGKNMLTIYERDLSQLDPHSWLGDNLIGFYIRFLEDHLERRDLSLAKQIHFFDPLFFSILTEGTAEGINYARIEKWTKNKDIFQLSHIIVPIHEGGHWYAAIINRPSSLLDKQGQCTIIMLDSLNIDHGVTIMKLQKYLAKELWSKQRQTVDLNLFNTVEAKNIPQQEDNNSCGLFLLAYLEKITQDPGHMIGQLVEPASDNIDWAGLVPNSLRSRMHAFLMELHEENKQLSHEETKNQKRMVDRTPISYLLGTPAQL
ncbi:hypothetical protein EYZ11_013156 [Aspergillus tanneri]|uniref:Histone H4 n=1 Tax=Aspergillus tanneri TaxID=1220188 RepID=A0A4S3J0H4_9EURO|nr:hypothetical protein EYZ11_013156 [Aspergillus tanneri]